MKTMMKNTNLMTRAALTLLVMMLTATTAWADDSGSCGNNVTYKYSESTHTLTISGSGAMENYGTPTPPWYSYRNYIKAVVIEDGVTYIGESAFRSCFLTSVSIPNSVTSIGDCAFIECSSLKSVTIPNSMTNIGQYAFLRCFSLKYVEVNAETPPTLGYHAFDFNADGRKICVPNSSVDTYKERWGIYANDIVDVSFLFSQDGDTYTIHSATGWDLFCNEVEGGKSFSGKTVVLDDDIVVTRMVGSIAKDFRGTFNGGGHRLTLHYGSVENPVDAQFVAPFPAVAGGAKFIDLTIDGYIHAGYKGSDEPGVGGLIGHLFGNVTVEHCVSNVVINSDKDRVGGFVGLCDHAVAFTDCKSSSVITCTGSSSGFVGWSRSSAFTIAFEGCLFDGNLLQQNGTGVSGGYFVGWKGDAKTVNINNCLVAPATLAEGESMASSGSATFCRQHNDQLPAVIKNSYYTTAFDADQGTQAHSIKAGEYVSVAMAGNVKKEYKTSGITFYNTGIMCDGKVYAVKDDVVSLTLSHEDQEGYAFLGYEAKDSLQNTFALIADGDNYKLTMPDDDVTVTANVVKVYSLTLPDGMEVVSATPAAIGGKYIEGTTIQFKVNSDYVVEGDVMNGDDVLTADADGIYTVKVENADITITASFIVTLSGNMSYTAQNGDVLTGSTSGTVTIAKDASITLSDVTINGGIVCEGTATIILVGENSVTGANDKAGIQVGDSGTTLTIKGNGALTANGRDSGAGIGTGCVYQGNVTFGDIIIEGGSITANGGRNSAGIGMGNVYDGSATLGDIIIEGGIITANGGYEGAGIGTGRVYQGNVTLGNITIEGGTVMATSSDGIANGIGKGYDFTSTIELGTLTIYDDIDLVEATGSNEYEWGIGCSIVYMHGETNVTGSASDYFIINHDDFSDVIKSKHCYSITLVYDEQHGTVTVPVSAKCDESVTITVTPDSGYMLDTIEVKDANGNEVSLKDMSFTMPKSDVTITVTWKLAGVKGDVNGDGTVDISDVVALVNIILNSSSDHQAEADLNNDGDIDISDVVALVNIILGQ